MRRRGYMYKPFSINFGNFVFSCYEPCIDLSLVGKNV